MWYMRVESSDHGDTVRRFPFSGLWTFFLCHCEDFSLNFSCKLGPLVAIYYDEIRVFGYPFLQGIGGRAYSSQSQYLSVRDALFQG